MGQVNMKAVFDDRGKCMLLGGFCVILDSFDTDLEIPTVDELGWNGTMTASIDGNGLIIIEPEIQLEAYDYCIVGSISPLDYVPYRTVETPAQRVPMHHREPSEVEMKVMSSEDEDLSYEDHHAKKKGKSAPSVAPSYLP